MINEIKYFRKNGYFEFPKIMQIEITTKCPLECPQCYKDIDNLYDMDFELLENIITEGKNNGLKSVMINGGEPLIYNKINELIELLDEKEIRASCFTSGVGITDEIINTIKKTRLFLNVSLNGSTEDINKLSRDGYEYAIEAIKIWGY